MRQGLGRHRELDTVDEICMISALEKENQQCSNNVTSLRKEISENDAMSSEPTVNNVGRPICYWSRED